MLQRVVFALLMALAWMPLTAIFSFESYSVGFLISFIILTLLFSKEEKTHIPGKNLPDRILAGIVYLLILFRDIYLSAIDVTKRVIDPKMPLNPGIIAVSTQYSAPDTPAMENAIAAISAHGITITPGELVVDFKEAEVMYVHCLDVVASSGVAEPNQTKRMNLLRRILL